MLSAMAALFVPRVSEAAQVVTTIIGTVAPGTSDQSGVFGTAGADLSGLSFILTYIFDDTTGTPSITTCCTPPVTIKTDLFGTGASSPGTAVLQIGDRSFTFGPSSDGNSEVWRSAPPGESRGYYYVSAADLVNDSAVVAFISPVADTILSSDPNWKSAFSNANLAANNLVYYGIQVSTDDGYLFSSGYLHATSITVSGPITLPTVTTVPASGIGPTAATLNGTVNPNAAATTAGFDYGFTISYGAVVSAGALSGSTVQAISASISSLACNTTYHFRTKGAIAAGTANGADVTFRTGMCPQPLAEVTAPAPFSTLSSSTVGFRWTGGTALSRYWLWVGSAAGGSDIYSQDQGTNLSAAVTGLPSDGRTLHVRLWSVRNGTWLFNDYPYTAASSAASRAEVTSPAPTSTLTATTVAFQWTGGTGVTRYWLWVGSGPGGSDLFSQDQGHTLNPTVAGLPADGRPLYVRLWSVIGSAWRFNDYVYTAASSTPARAELTTPAPQSTLTATTVAFQWTGGTGVTQYWLWIGNAPATSDLVSQNQGTNPIATVSGLPDDGRALYVRLWSVIDGAWLFIDYTYTATSDIPARAELISPPPASTLTATTSIFNWTGGKGVTKYWLWVGSTPGGSDLLSQDQGTTTSGIVVGLPADGRPLSVRLWSVIGGAWLFHDYAYTASSGRLTHAELTSPAPSSTLTSTTVEFAWTGGTAVTRYWLWVGSSPGSSDLRSQDQGTNPVATIVGLPADGRALYVRLWSVIGGAWLFTDYPLTASSSAPSRAELRSPAPASTLTATTVQLQWTGGTAVTRYWLWLGNSPGGSDLFSQDQGTNLSATVGGIPADGRPLYVRLWSVIGGAWLFNDYPYTATPRP